MIPSPSNNPRIVREININSSNHNTGLMVVSNKTGAETAPYDHRNAISLFGTKDKGLMTKLKTIKLKKKVHKHWRMRSCILITASEP